MTAPAPFLAKPSILDRVLGRLFPTGPYQGLLEPAVQRDLQREGLLRLGTGILSQTGPGNALSAFGKAYQGLDFGTMAQQALQVQAYKQHLANQAAISATVAKHPVKPGETPEGTYNRLAAIEADLVGVPGSEDLIAKLAQVIGHLKQPRPGWTFKSLHENGQDVIYRVNNDTGEKYRVGLAPPSPGQTLGSVTARETAAAAQNALAALNEADAILARDPQADILPTATAVARGAERVPVIGSVLSGAMEPVAQHAMSSNQKLFQQAMDQFLHNYSALLPRGGRSVQILRNLRASFAPSAGQEAPEVRQGFASARAQLRATLQALAQGHTPVLPGSERIPSGGEVNGEETSRYHDNPY